MAQTTTIGNYALFGGGNNNGSIVDVYDASLTRTATTNLSIYRYMHAATTVGNYALFGGGYGSYDTVEAYYVWE